MNQIGLSSNQLRKTQEGCLAEQTMIRLVGEPIYKGVVNGMDRLMVRIYEDGNRYWCDARTGTLYADDLRCVTSFNLRLKAVPKKTADKVSKKHVGSY